MPLNGKSGLVMTYDKKKKRKGCKRKISDQEEVAPATKVLKQVCFFCQSSEENEVDYGELITRGDITVHYFCMLLSSGLGQNGKLSNKSTIRGFLKTDILKELKRGSRLKCCFCQEKGATIGCCVGACKKKFHLPCGRKNKTFHLFYDKFSSFCQQHWLLHRDSAIDDSSCCSNEKPACVICLSAIDDKTSSNSLFSLCCTKPWFHRGCMQGYALSAGKHFFKCPLCNCLKDFQQKMLHSGIYIPDQDASWERQPNAFSELLERHSTCDAPECKCPQGRSHNATKGSFHLLLCQTCGSFGSHEACQGLVEVGISFQCPLCSEIDAIQATSKLQVENNKSIGSSSMHLNCEGGGTHSQTNPRTLSSSSLMNSVQVTADRDFVKVDMENIENGDALNNLQEERKDFHKDDFDDESLLKSVSMPSVVVVRIDSLFPLPSGAVKLKTLLKWKYDENAGCFVRRRSYNKSGKYSKNDKRVGKPAKSHDQDAGCLEKRSPIQTRLHGIKHKQERKITSWFNQDTGFFVKRPSVESGVNNEKQEGGEEPVKSHDQKYAGCCCGNVPFVKRGMQSKNQKEKEKQTKRVNHQDTTSLLKRPFVKSGMYSKKCKGNGKPPFLKSEVHSKKHKQKVKATKRYDQQDARCFVKKSCVKRGMQRKSHKQEDKQTIRVNQQDTVCSIKRPLVKSEMFSKKWKGNAKSAKISDQKDAGRFVKKSYLKSGICGERHNVKNKPANGHDQQDAGCFVKGKYVKNGIISKKHTIKAKIAKKYVKTSCVTSGKHLWQEEIANKMDTPVNRKTEILMPKVTKRRRKKVDSNDRSPSTQLTLDMIWKTAFTKSTSVSNKEKTTQNCQRVASEKDLVEKKKEEFDENKKVERKSADKKIIAIQKIANKKKSIALQRMAFRMNIGDEEQRKDFLPDSNLKICSESPSVFRKRYVAKRIARREIEGFNGTQPADKNLVHVPAMSIVREKTARKKVKIRECQQSSETIFKIHPGPLSDSNNQENQATRNICVADLTPVSHDISNPLSKLDINCGTKKGSIMTSSTGKNSVETETESRVKKYLSNLQFGISNPFSDLDVTYETKEGSDVTSSIEKKSDEMEMEVKKDESNLQVAISEPLPDLITCVTKEGRNKSSSIDEKSMCAETEMKVQNVVTNLQVGISNPLSDFDITYETKEGSDMSSSIEKKSDDIETEMEVQKDVSNLQVGISNPLSDLDITYETNEKCDDIETERKVKKNVSNLQVGISDPLSDLITFEAKEESINSSSIEKKSDDTETEMGVQKDVSNLQVGISDPLSDLITFEAKEESINSSSIEKKSDDTETEMEVQKDVSNLQVGISDPQSDLITCETKEVSIKSISIEKKSDDTETEMEVQKDVSNLQVGISDPNSDLITCETKEVSIKSSSIEKKSDDTEKEMEVQKDVCNLQVGISDPLSDLITCKTKEESINSSSIEKKSDYIEKEMDVPKNVSNLQISISDPLSDLITCKTKEESIKSSSIEKKSDDTETGMEVQKDGSNLQVGISDPLSDIVTSETKQI